MRHDLVRIVVDTNVLIAGLVAEKGAVTDLISQPVFLGHFL